MNMSKYKLADFYQKFTRNWITSFIFVLLSYKSYFRQICHLFFRAPLCVARIRILLAEFFFLLSNSVSFRWDVLKDTPWKVATDEITNLLRFHLQFHMNVKGSFKNTFARISGNAVRLALATGCLFVWFEGRPPAFSFTRGQYFFTMKSRKFFINIHCP